MTKLQLHYLSVLSDDIYTELVELDKCPLTDLWDKVDSIRSKAYYLACDLTCRLDDYDEHTTHDFGEGIKLED